MKLTRSCNEIKYVIKEFCQLPMGECFIISDDYVKSDYNVYIKTDTPRYACNAYNLTLNCQNIIENDTKVYVLNANLLWDFAKIDAIED